MENLFDTFTSSEEYNSWITDEFDRKRLFSNSNLPIFTPGVSNKLFELGLNPVYPGNRKFAFCLSHDIDLLYQRASGFQKVKNLLNPSGAKSKEVVEYNLSSFFKKKIYPFYSLDKLSAINQTWNIQATYFFLALKTGERDFNYVLQDINGEVERLTNLNNEIGLHGGHKAFSDFDQLSAEKNRFESSTGVQCFGYRNHYLRFDLKQTWQILQRSGFVYDTTFGYADSVGFRNGMCYPFFPYDLAKKSFLSITELPLIAMDATFFYYMRMEFSMIKRVISDLVLKTSEIGGVFTLLWHNNHLHGEYEKLYNEILEIILSMDPWITTSGNLVDWWKTQGFLDKQKGLMEEYFNLRSA